MIRHGIQRANLGKRSHQFLHPLQLPRQRCNQQIRIRLDAWIGESILDRVRETPMTHLCSRVADDGAVEVLLVEEGVFEDEETGV